MSPGKCPGSRLLLGAAHCTHCWSPGTLRLLVPQLLPFWGHYGYHLWAAADKQGKR